MAFCWVVMRIEEGLKMMGWKEEFSSLVLRKARHDPAAYATSAPHHAKF
jgi:hypothetical protein